MKFNYQLGDLIYIQFWDHAMGDKACFCETMGYVIEADNVFIKLAYWELPAESTESKAINREVLTIIKSAI